MTEALKQAAQQALEALEQVNAPKQWPFAVKQDTRRAIEELRAALSAPQPAAPQQDEINRLRIENDVLRTNLEAAVAQAEPFWWVALLDEAQRPHQLKTDLHRVGFRNKASADEWVASNETFNGWHYTLHPLYLAPAPAQAVPLTDFQIDAVTEAAHQTLRRACSGAQGQQMTMWHGIEAHVVRATERAHGIKQPGSEA